MFDTFWAAPIYMYVTLYSKVESGCRGGNVANSRLCNKGTALADLGEHDVVKKLNREEGSRRGREGLQLPIAAFEGEDGAINQGIRASSTSWKRSKDRFSPRVPQKTCRCFCFTRGDLGKIQKCKKINSDCFSH